MVTASFPAEYFSDAMKILNILAALIVAISFLLLPVMSNSVLNPSGQGVFQKGAKSDSLIGVALAKEPVYIILVEKNLQRLRVLEYDNELQVVAEYPSATGENFGIKEISGDSKTPEGIYFITKIFKDDEITIFGDKAFHLDYPNFFDQQAGRNGDGIYIHGTNKKLIPKSTNGCVTLANSDLDDLENYINQVVTPVIIVPELNGAANTKIQLLTENDFSLAKSLLLAEEIKEDNVEYNYLYIVNFGNQTVAVSDFIYRPFNRSLMRGASRTYLEYIPEKGWTARKRIWRVSPLQIYPEAPFKIAAKPLTTGGVQMMEQTEEEAAAMMAALNPGSVPLQRAVMNEQFQAVSRGIANAPPDMQKKSQPLETALPDEKAAQPVSMQAGIVPSTPTPRTITSDKIKQSKKIMVAAPVIPKDEQQVVDFVENWRQAWVSQAIDPYISFYDKTFKGDGKNLAQWKAHKAKLNRTYEFISVNISKIEVSWTDDGAAVSFRQEYRSDRYRATGNKTLLLIYSDAGWKIKREIYSRS